MKKIKWFAMGVILCMMLMGGCVGKDPIESITESEEMFVLPTVQESHCEQIESETNTITDENKDEPTDIITDDWDNDMVLDELKIWNLEMEGSIYLIKLELTLSSVTEPYVIENPVESFSYHDILFGDYDQDGQNEIALVFDLHGARVGESFGLYLLDVLEGRINNICNNKLFSGYSYEVVSIPEEHSYEITGTKSGNKLFLETSGEYEGNSGSVTSLYSATTANEGGKEYLEIRQRVLGEFSTDYLADLVVALSLKGGNICIDNEWIEMNKKLEE